MKHLFSAIAVSVADNSPPAMITVISDNRLPTLLIKKEKATRHIIMHNIKDLVYFSCNLSIGTSSRLTTSGL